MKMLLARIAPAPLDVLDVLAAWVPVPFVICTVVVWSEDCAPSKRGDDARQLHVQVQKLAIQPIHAPKKYVKRKGEKKKMKPQGVTWRMRTRLPLKRSERKKSILPPTTFVFVSSVPPPRSVRAGGGPSSG